jgi:Transposase DNA-binding
MEVGNPLDASLGQIHFGSVVLGDQRRTRRLVNIADQFFIHPGGTLPQKLRRPADLKAMYRLMDNESVTHEAVLRSHCQRTLEQMRQQTGPVLVIHDTTELDYTGHRSMREQLGPLGSGYGRGFVCHNSLAITPEGQVLGLTAQQLHKRRVVDKSETRKQKQRHPQRESRLWQAGCEQTGPAPASALWIDICDRGADSYEFLEYESQHDRHFVIRCSKDRVLAGEDHLGCDRIYQKLFAYTRDLPELGRRDVEVTARGVARGRPKPLPARTAQVRVAAGPVTLRAPARSECDEPELNLWIIHVQEISEIPANDHPLEWLLLSNLPANTFSQACQLIDYYACRPLIEDLHKGMKTGCGIETPQFTDCKRLQPMIALLSVIAAVLLDLRQLARNPATAELPAEHYVQPCFVQVLCGWRYKDQNPPDPMSIKDFCYALARLGGHQNRKNDGPPGWLTLWRGWQNLNLMVQGAVAVGLNRCG